MKFLRRLFVWWFYGLFWSVPIGGTLLIVWATDSFWLGLAFFVVFVFFGETLIRWYGRILFRIPLLRAWDRACSAAAEVEREVSPEERHAEVMRSRRRLFWLLGIFLLLAALIMYGIILPMWSE